MSGAYAPLLKYMFVKAIEKVSKFTRPIHTITRNYNDDAIMPGASSMFFVNEFGHAITCRHVAQIIMRSEEINKNYKEFKNEASLLSKNKYNRKIKELERKYNYSNNITIQIKNNFINCADFKGFEIICHPNFDLAIIKFSDFEKLHYTEHAILLKDSVKIKQGKSLCRLGYPFPEFSNFAYDKENDDIKWTAEGKQITPTFPIDGIVTRGISGIDGSRIGIELSTPGLRGQSGGPLFDENGIIYGMQSMTHHLHLGFDIVEKEIFVNRKIKKVSNHPFLHLGNCVHVDIIKNFLKEKDIKYYEE